MNDNPYQSPAEAVSEKPPRRLAVTGFQLLLLGLLSCFFKVLLSLGDITIDNVDPELNGVVVAAGYAAWLGVAFAVVGLAILGAAASRRFKKKSPD